MEGIEEERVCAFIDILGFRQAMLSDDEAQRTNLIGLVKRLAERQFRHGHHTRPLRIGWVSYPTPEVTAFSDSVVISFPLQTIYWKTEIAGETRAIPFEPSTFLEGAFAQIVRAVWDGLGLGVLVRGAIVVDDLYHEGDVVAGRALVRAVKLEERTGKPRIHIAPEVLDARTDMGRPLIQDPFKSACILERDDEWMFDVAGFHNCLWRDYAHEEEWEDPTEADVLRRAEQIKAVIGEKLEYHREHSPEGVVEKWEWFHDYFNDSISSGSWQEIRERVEGSREEKG